MKKLVVLLAIFMIQSGYSLNTSRKKINTDNYYDKYSSESTGNLFIIGGGVIPDYMWQKFMGLSKDQEKRVLVIPQANKAPGAPGSTGILQQQKFLELGAVTSDILLCKREELDNLENLDKLAKVNLVFFSGGHQARLAEYLNGTEFLNRLHKFYKEGGTIGGTSAGAAVMSKVMIGGGRKDVEPGRERFVTLKKDHVVTLDGFGFMENVVIHQHFLYRKRNNTLLSVLLDNPRARGIGIDETTAIIVKPDKTFDVFGESKVVVYEPASDFTDEQTHPMFTVHILSANDSYKL